jgi:hypothetical protein
MPIAADIVVPDDCPSVLADTQAEARLRRLGSVSLHRDRLARDSDELSSVARPAPVMAHESLEGDKAWISVESIPGPI